MKCPSCNYFNSKVIDSRSIQKSSSIRRRRCCLKCGFRFTTYEYTLKYPVMIIKKNGDREEYDRLKIEKSFLRAFVGSCRRGNDQCRSAARDPCRLGARFAFHRDARPCRGAPPRLRARRLHAHALSDPALGPLPPVLADVADRLQRATSPFFAPPPLQERYGSARAAGRPASCGEDVNIESRPARKQIAARTTLTSTPL